jgi:hypothetical protein
MELATDPALSDPCRELIVDRIGRWRAIAIPVPNPVIQPQAAQEPEAGLEPGALLEDLARSSAEDRLHDIRVQTIESLTHWKAPARAGSQQ